MDVCIQCGQDSKHSFVCDDGRILYGICPMGSTPPPIETQLAMRTWERDLYHSLLAQVLIAADWHWTERPQTAITRLLEELETLRKAKP